MESENMPQRLNSNMYGRSQENHKYSSMDFTAVSFKQLTSNRGVCKFPPIPYKILCCTGLVEQSDKYFSYKIAKHCIIFMFTFLVIISWAPYIAQSNFRDIKIRFALLSGFITPLIIYYAMLQKRKLLTATLSKLNGMPPYNKKINLFAFLLCCMPFVYTVWVTVTCNKRNAAKHLAYGYDIESVPVQIFLVSSKCFLSAILRPGFSNFVALVFCILCQRCCTRVEMLTLEVQQVPPEAFGIPKQIDMIKRKAKIEDILQNIQDIFSLPSFLLVVENFLSCSAIIGFYLYNGSEKSVTHTYAQSFLHTLNSLGCLVLMIWVVGGVPIQMRKLKEAFRKKKRLRLIYVCAREEISLHAECFENSDFVFTGCDVISFRRTLILAILGTLLTYTALLINWVTK
ncbi:uncharacterized protein TNIN_495041 [Trichonephila inaurata madagascariensis]|uniref:Uncharacterized protein n=1 Tax=Trichonephila inaurata madagascariensis TaxID=2747483 RepID=A0A8X6WPJ9_9ARAC|nr:uncharacterized protein TNIN_495041 [Trichonephila inaurata madagascariensis]